MKPDSYLAINLNDEKQQIVDSCPSSRSEEEGGEEKEEGEMVCCMMLLRRKLHYLPIFTWFFIMSSFFTAFFIARYHGHVMPADFPYISYTAIKTPERCYFSQLINIGAVLLASNVFLRFLQIKEVCKIYHISTPYHRRLNICTAVVGFLSSLGFSMVANFQTVDMRPLHYTGAGLAFIFGLCYCWMSSALTWKMRRRLHNTFVAVLQIINSTALSIFIVVFGVSKSIYKYKEIHNMGTKWDTLRTVYLLSTTTEWLTATLIITFVLTMYWDFKKIRFYGPTVKFIPQLAMPSSNGTTNTIANCQLIQVPTSSETAHHLGVLNGNSRSAIEV